ncbi:hypothetical protein MNBD_GAMMA24-2191 [hydrothermal vent metagenome]|uniref:Methyl-accepting chemotaxis sensor/transducer protein n=1 Tax=hydrothermal vent metagenome TaxID=652676 RepID=A0A3B1B5Z1_9ZZZZ
MFKTLTIQKKFYGLIALTVLLGLSLILLTYMTLEPVKSSFNQYVESAVKRHELLLKMRAGLGYGGSIHAFKNYILRGKNKYIKQFNSSQETVLQALRQYQKLSDLTPAESHALATIKNVVDNYSLQLNHVRDMLASGMTAGKIDTAITIDDSQAIQGLNTLQAHFDKITAEHSRKLDNNINSMLEELTIWIIVVVSALLLGLFMLNISITRRINAVVASMTNIAHGEGDLTQHLDDRGSDEISVLSARFNDFVGMMASLVGEMSKTSEHLVKCMDEISRNSSQTDQGVTEQQSELEQIVTAMHEMSASVHEVANSAAGAAEAARQADEEAINGRNVVAQSVGAIDSLAREVHSTTSVMEKLRVNSEGISNVMEVIRSIAEQTNLLALNAAIEAARAGEQGRGFAVVADEVRTLANRTQQSTAEIQQMVEGLQTGVNAAMQAMELSQNEAKTGVEKTGRVQESLDKLAHAVTTIHDLNIQIASAAEQQSKVAEEIDLNVINVNRVAGETAQGAHQTNNLAEEMTGLVSELQTEIAQFKI